MRRRSNTIKGSLALILSSLIIMKQDEDALLISIVRVQYIGEDNPLSLRHGKVYEARVLQKNWFGVVDETKEEYAYPPELFILVEENHISTE
jgi:hypothetical protein